ncbi:MAG: hypothetical protein JWM10_3625, partial [Myxococcaceae bacterium]|nr:hypothetical protein [Myxococcaceae bacterium]
MRGNRRRVGAIAAILAAGCGEATTTRSDAATAVDAAATDAAVDAAAADVTADLTDAGETFALAPGEVAEVPLSAGVASLRIATPSGTERYVLVLASTQLDAVGDPVAYA